MRPDMRAGAQLQVLTQRLLDQRLAAPLPILAALAWVLGFVIVQNGLLGGSHAIAREVGGDYLRFIVPAGMLLASVKSGTAGFLIAQDKEDGYLDRLLTMPVARATIVLAPILFGTGYAALLSLAVLGTGMCMGAVPAAGAPGVFAMLALVSLWAMGVAGYMTFTALVSGSLETTWTVDFIAYPLLFLSPILLPADQLMGWMRELAQLNPTTYVLGGLRSLMYHGWDLGSVWPALCAAGVFAAATLSAAAVAAQRTIRRDR